jgi:hypothetical protein
MKKITTLLMSILVMTSAFGQAQQDTTKIIGPPVDFNDCSNWITTTTDKVDGTTYTAGKNDLIISADGGKKGISIYMFIPKDNALILSIKAVGASSCIDDENKINFLFTDGSRLAMVNNAQFNCKGNASLFFGGILGKKRELEQLKTKKIQTMRVWTTDGYVEEDFTVEQQEEFFNVINCLSN